MAMRLLGGSQAPNWGVVIAKVVNINKKRVIIYQPTCGHLSL